MFYPNAAVCGKVADLPGAVCPRCWKRHRSWHNLARCRFRRGLAWVSGNPPPWGPCFATVTRCTHHHYRGAQVSVMLWPTEARAEEALALVNATGCGGGCSGRHELVAMRQAGE
jgi:hypothetical protein